MSARSEASHIEYRSVQTGPQEWTVFCLDDREPEWWRAIARFASQKRADSYAEIETMMADDFEEDERDAMVDGVHGNVPTSTEPKSNITVGKIVRRESIAHTRIEREETVTLEELQRQAIAAPDARSATVDEIKRWTREEDAELERLWTETADTAEDIGAKIGRTTQAVYTRVKHREIPGRSQGRKVAEAKIANEVVSAVRLDEDDTDVLPEPVDCATLDPLTPIQFKLFGIIAGAGGKYLSSADVDKASGHPGLFGNVVGLVKKGYVRARAISGGRNAYDVLIFGAPRVYGSTAPIPANLRKAIRNDAPPRKAPVAPAGKPAIAAEETRNMTSELMGDPVSGRSAAERSDFDVKSYLVRKGHTAFRAGSTWVIDGRQREREEVLDIVNGYRAKADLPPLETGAIA